MFHDHNDSGTISHIKRSENRSGVDTFALVPQLDPNFVLIDVHNFKMEIPLILGAYASGLVSIAHEGAYNTSLACFGFTHH